MAESPEWLSILVYYPLLIRLLWYLLIFTHWARCVDTVRSKAPRNSAKAGNSMKVQTKRSSAIRPDLLQRGLLPALMAGCFIAAVTIPAHAQVAQSGTMVYSLARMVPQMGSMLVRSVPHGGHKKNKNNPNSDTSNNTTNPNGQALGQNYGAPNYAMQQQFPGANGQFNQGYMPPGGQPGYGNMQAQGYPMQNAQQMNANVPGLNYGTQGPQSGYGAVQGQMYGGATGQSAYGMPAQGATGPYGPTGGQ
jgi:hypothetical protein